MSLAMPESIGIDMRSIGEECRQELYAIAEWWIEHVIDFGKRGFAGEVDDKNKVNPVAHKSAVYSTRLLWYFSETARVTGNRRYREAADLVYQYLLDHFYDREHGGIYWEIDHEGNVVNSRKQVYAQAFYIYSLCAYYRLHGNQDVLSRAMEIFKLIETKAHDDQKNGYIEALNREWGPQEDLRLSDKEPNLPKTMNTHLHIMEAYTVLHTIVSSRATESSLKRVLGYFTDYFVDRKTGHLRIFFDENWNDKSTGYSYGHDIECSWLMWEAAEALAGNDMLEQIKSLAPVIASTCLTEGSGAYGELLDGYDFASDRIVPEHVWWVQAEALVGYLNAYQITGQKIFSAAFADTWKFIKAYQKNTQHGEWHWFSTLDLHTETQPYKAGFWKASYHNGRAMMEVSRRLLEITKAPN
jgi:mannobiose 2-epimerase